MLFITTSVLFFLLIISLIAYVRLYGSEGDNGNE